MNEYVFLTSTKFITFSCSIMYLLFLCFFDPCSIGANYRQDVLHITYYIISSSFFGWNSSLSRLFQLVVSCHWHMNMCCPIKLHVDMITLIKKLYVNAKGENGKIFFAFSMWEQPWWSLFDVLHGTQSCLYLFSYFRNHKLYKFVIFYNYVNVMRELYA
jgi:hypothetical protein